MVITNNHGGSDLKKKNINIELLMLLATFLLTLLSIEVEQQ